MKKLSCFFLLIITILSMSVFSAFSAQDEEEISSAIILGVVTDEKDPFNSFDRQKLLALEEGIAQHQYKAIFNGVGVNEIELFEDTEAFWLKSVQSSFELSQALQIITKEQPNVDALLKGANQEEGDLLRIAYNAGPQALWSDIIEDIKKYLQSKVDQGVVSSFNLLEYPHEVEITYPHDPLIKSFTPLWTIKQIRYLLDAFKDTSTYANNVFKTYQDRINNGEVLIVYQQEGKTEHLFMSVDDVQAKFKEVDEFFQLKKQEKEQSVSNSFFNFFKKVFNSSTTLAWAQESPSVLNDQSGTIVPGSKNVVLLEAPDYIVMRAFGKKYAQGSYLKSEAKKFFQPLLMNGYGISFQGAGWNEPFVEKLEQVLLDENIQIVLFHTHGGKEILLAELWDLGAIQKEQGPTLKRERFLNRLTELQQKYGENSLYAREMRSQLDQEDADSLASQSAGFPDKIKSWIKEPVMLGSIRLRAEFFRSSKFKEKSLFILWACYGGSLSDAIKARVLLASRPEYATTSSLFFSDLQKVFSCMVKEKTCPFVEQMDKLKQHRNTNLVSLFEQKQFAINDEKGQPIDSSLEFELTKTCNANPKALCSLKWYGQEDASVAISPHIEETSPREIVFNVPMDQKEKPEEMISLDYSRCVDVQEENINKNPEWKDERTISLPWEGGFYRDWEDTDFDEQGRPKVDYAIVTIDSQKALSALSRIPLTGNPDACTNKGCFQPESWKDPSAIKFNGNQPNSSFTFTMPCLKKEYYSPCGEGAGGLIMIRDHKGEQGSFLMPQYIKIKGECYQRTKPDHPENAVEVMEWEQADDCLSICQDAQACFSHIFERGFVQDDRAITYINPDGKTYEKAEVKTFFLNGKEIEDCREKSIYNNVTQQSSRSWCAEPNAFAKNFAWIKILTEDDLSNVVESMKFKHELYYNGKLYDVAEDNESISNLMLYKQGVYYLKSVNGSAHVFYNKKDYGDLQTLSNNNDFLNFPEIKFNLSDYQTGNLDFFYRQPDVSPEKPVFDERLIPARVEASQRLVEENRARCLSVPGDRSYCLKDIEQYACGVPDPTTGIEHDQDYCAGALVSAEFVGYVDKSPLWATHLDGESNPFNGLLNYQGALPSRKSPRAFFWERKYVVLDEQDQFEEDWQEVSMTLADVVKRDFALYVGRAVYWNGLKRYDCENGCWGSRVFGEHLAFVNKEDQVIYDGRSLAKIDTDHPILYQDHVGFYIHQEDPLVSSLSNSKDYVYIDGHIYDRESSMLVNLYTCRQTHLE